MIDVLIHMLQKLSETQSEAPIKVWVDALCVLLHSSKLWMTALIGIRDVYTCVCRAALRLTVSLY